VHLQSLCVPTRFAGAARSVLVFKTDEDKITNLDKHKLIAGAGPTGDRVQFIEYIQKNITLYELKTGVEMSTQAAATFTRNQLAEALRKNPYQVNLLIGGYDEKCGPSLYYMDYLASMHTVKFGAHGYAAAFTLSIMDRYYKKDMTLEEGKDLLRKCIKEVQTRFLINLPKFNVKMANKDGVSEISL